MGRIRRIGVDSMTNYSFLQTSAYDANNPAATTSAWPDDAAMDQDPRQASPTEVTAEGVLITFERFPDTFTGAHVKVQPTYDFDSGGENPFLEMWLHDSETSTWTKRSSVQFANVFVGAKTGVRKIFDFTFFPFERNIDMVWLTMNPGAVGTPSMDFAMIRLFGKCEQTLPRDGDETDPCADPNNPFYTGLDDEGNPCPGTTFGPPPTTPEIPALDLCNPVSIEQYREAVKDIPGFVEQFDAWYATNIEAIQLYCAGTNPDPPTGQPPPPHPAVLPPLDLCDQDSIDAFRAALPTPEAVASFDDFIDGLESDGFFDFTCPPPVPPEEYIDPNTLEPATEPDPVLEPFGQVPSTASPRPSGPTASLPPQHGGPSQPDSNILSTTYIGFYFYGDSPTTPGETMEDWAVPLLQSEGSQEMKDAYIARTESHVFPGIPSNTGEQFNFTNVIEGTITQIRGRLIFFAGGGSGYNEATVFDGDGGHGGSQPDIDEGGGVFSTQTPIPGAQFFALNRSAPVGFVDFLRMKCFAGFPTPTNSVFVYKIIAEKPGSTGQIAITGTTY